MFWNWLGTILLLFSLALCAADLDERSAFGKMNAAFGLKIWSDDSLWDDADTTVAKVLSLNRESQTTNETSYRSYPAADHHVLGARVFSIALYGKAGKVERLTLVFANRGDVEKHSSGNGLLDVADRRHNEAVMKEVLQEIQEDARTVENNLTNALGPGEKEILDQGTCIEEPITRWNWLGHTLVLAAPPNEYVMLRIVPAETSVASAEDIRQQLAARVEKRENGDVIIKDIPMANQGGKGFCVPATWERYLRYMGVPADMYVLAMAGHGGTGGGTHPKKLAMGIQALTARYQRTIERVNFPISMKNVAESIDQGQPLMWTMFVVSRIDGDVTKRSALRPKTGNLEAWEQELQPVRDAVKNLKLTVDTSGSDDDSGRSHECLLIGYNAATREFAISDSWGPAYVERWLTEEEAQKINGSGFWIIK